MKKKISFNINFTNRAIYTLITFSIFLLIGISVFAFGTSSPSTFGHSAGELDLSSGVNGDALFLGNVKTNGNMDVAGGIKVGTIATCDENTEGFQRYNSESKKIEFCNSTDWGEMSGGVEGIGGVSYEGVTPVLRNGNLGGPFGADDFCDAAYEGSHMCDLQEMRLTLLPSYEYDGWYSLWGPVTTTASEVNLFWPEGGGRVQKPVGYAVDCYSFSVAYSTYYAPVMTQAGVSEWRNCAGTARIHCCK